LAKCDILTLSRTPSTEFKDSKHLGLIAAHFVLRWANKKCQYANWAGLWSQALCSNTLPLPKDRVLRSDSPTPAKELHEHRKTAFAKLVITWHIFHNLNFLLFPESTFKIIQPYFIQLCYKDCEADTEQKYGRNQIYTGCWQREALVS
jgi:hypothetical protein